MPSVASPAPAPTPRPRPVRPAPSDTALRVVVLDDDPIFRSFLAKTLLHAGIEVVGLCPTVETAKKRLDAGDVDAVSIDVVLRGESGLDFLRWCHQHHRDVITVLVTAGSAKEARTGVDAVFLGAAALLTKPDSRNIAEFETELRRVFADGRVATTPLVTREKQLVDRAKARITLQPAPRTELLVVGASTGGPPVLLTLLARLPEAFEVPILIAQHMPSPHIPYLAQLLAERSGRTVVVAKDGEPIRRGTVYLAGNGRHLNVSRIDNQLVTTWFDGPPEHYCKPAVDSLFRSAAKHCKGSAVGIVLTGMGDDGASGAVALRAAGNPVLVQNAATSVVWGMPGAVAALGAADAVLPAELLAAGVVEWMGWKGRAS